MQTAFQIELAQKANQIKSNIKKLFKQIDSGSSGCIKFDLFSQLLTLHKINLSKLDIDFLRSRYLKQQSGSEYILFKEALNHIYIDFSLVNPTEQNWIVRKLERGTSKAGSTIYGLSLKDRDDQQSQYLRRSVIGFENKAKLLAINEYQDRNQKNMNRALSVASSAKLSRASSQKSIKEQGQGQQKPNNSPYKNEENRFRQQNQYQPTNLHHSSSIELQNAPEKLSEMSKEGLIEETSWKPENYDQGSWDLKGRKRYNNKMLNHSSKQYDIIQNRNSDSLQLNSGDLKNLNKSMMLNTLGDFQAAQGPRRNSVIHDESQSKEWTPYNKSLYSNSHYGTVTSKSGGKHDRPQELRSNILDRYLSRLLDKDPAQLSKVNIVNAMYEMNVDNRILNNLRQTMNNWIQEEKGLLSVRQFRELFMSFFKDNLKCNTIYDLLLPVIMEGEGVSIGKLSAFIDFFNFLPFKIRKHKNSSQEMFQVMNSNKQKQGIYNYNAEASDKSTKESQNQEKKTFNQLLGMIWAKIYERFPNINAAFRFFDSNLDQEIHFNEFAQGIEYLRLKLPYEDIWKIYRYMDTNGDGHVSYSEFCQLCEEKWRNIDPFETLQNHKEQQQLRLKELREKEIRFIEQKEAQKQKQLETESMLQQLQAKLNPQQSDLNALKPRDLFLRQFQHRNSVLTQQNFHTSGANKQSPSTFSTIQEELNRKSIANMSQMSSSFIKDSRQSIRKLGALNKSIDLGKYNKDLKEKQNLPQIQSQNQDQLANSDNGSIAQLRQSHQFLNEKNLKQSNLQQNVSISKINEQQNFYISRSKGSKSLNKSHQGKYNVTIDQRHNLNVLHQNDISFDQKKNIKEQLYADYFKNKKEMRSTIVK